MVGAPVEQGRQHAPHLQAAVGEAAHVVHGVEQLADAAVAQRLALQGDQHALRRGQGGHGEHAQRRRAVQQHPVVVLVRVLERLQRRAHHVLPPGAGQQVGLGARELDGRRQQVDALLGGDQHLGRLDAGGEDVVHRELEVLGVDAQRERQAGLGVEVDEQHPLPLLGERRPEGGHGRRLGDAALLVGDGEDRGHRGPLCTARLPIGRSHLDAGPHVGPEPRPVRAARVLPVGPRGRPGHRRHGRDRAGLRRAPRRARPRPRAGRPRRRASRRDDRAPGRPARRGRRAAGRRPLRARPAGARGGAGGRPPSTGGRAREQRRVRPARPLPGERPRRRAADARRARDGHAAPDARGARRDDRARGGGRRQRLQRRRLPSRGARTPPRRRGSPASAGGRPWSTARAGCG